jgi:hypothetical protein
MKSPGTTAKENSAIIISRTPLISAMPFMTLLVLALTVTSIAAAAETIFVQPGQCIMVGSQQVCAQKNDATASTEPTYACRFAEHKGGDLPGYKTYGLVKIVTRPNGSVTEMLIKDFGIKGKDKCDAAAEDRRK